MHKSKTVQSSTESIKILVLLQDEEIKWMSLKKIQRGYLKSISLIKNTHLVYVKSGPQFFSFLDEIDTHQPDVVVFLDISLQNPELIKLILGRMAKKLRFIFVLYGGFIQSTYPAWRSQEKDLKGLDIGFVSASNAYKDIQQKYFLNKSALHTIPYPVEIVAQRSSKKKTGEFHIIYAGRLALQKNWLILFDIFKKCTHVDGKKIFLHMAGPIDNSGLKDLNSEGYFEREIESYKIEFPHVKWHGHLNEKKLTELMLKMDASISLSTFAYEDFGMVIPESLLLGLPVIATEWGGYADFCKLFPDMIITIPTKNRKSVVTIEASKVLEAIKKVGSAGSSKMEIDRVSDYFHPVKIARQMENLFRQKTLFKGMTNHKSDERPGFFNIGLQ